MQATTPPKNEGLDGLGILNLSDPDYAKKLLNESKSAIGNLTADANAINALFGQTRQRIVEIQTSIADAVPEITRLGGGVAETVQTISQAAEASNRNVIITTQQTEKLYAASKVLGMSVDSLVGGFADVGVGIDKIPEGLEKSLEYIRSVGGNSEQIFKKVSSNMEQLNRYQFQGGVEGLTKMATQASMLRFNMNETFQLAEKVLDPEGAIEVAGAFQRLGVSAGNLVDPFQLMNQSINDPSGLQNSLADVAKQFTYFDEETKTFKINPQGVLTLREMEKQTGVSAKEMSKLGLAAAEADKRISEIKGVGLNLSEEDNLLLANISRMGDGGEYEVKVKNQEGKEYYEKISKIGQDQLEATLKEQKDGPKTLEDLQRSQLTLTDIIKADLNAIKEKVVFGFVSPQTILKGLEDARGVVSKGGGEISKSFDTKDVREFSSSLIKPFEEMIKKLGKEGKLSKEDLAKALDGLQSASDGAKSKVEGMITKMVGKISENEYNQEMMKKLGISTNSQTPQGKTKVNNVQSQQIKSLMYGKDGVSKQLEDVTTKNNMTSMTTKSTVDVGGKIQVEFATTNGSELSKKVLDDWANSPQTKEYFINLVKPQNPMQASNKTTFGN
jgi:hypothetical protein